MIIFASNNKGKIKEVKSILESENIISLKEAGIQIDINEDQETFEGNATKKAQTIYEITNIPTIADDSGLCILALNNFPGVHTHRFLGENKTDEEINEALIKKCQDVAKDAKVVCAIAYCDGERLITTEGTIDGKIVPARGKNGFGFDPIFELPNGKTLAELSAEEKNSTSARKLALTKLRTKLNK